jgi:hypothetical protein
LVPEGSGDDYAGVTEPPDGILGRAAAGIRSNIRPILIVVIPALLIAALTPVGEGLRELLFPTRVTVTGTLQLPQGDFPDLVLALDEETRVPPDESGAFRFDGVGKGNHTIVIEASGLSRQPLAFTVAPRSPDIDLHEVAVTPAVSVVGTTSATPSPGSITFDTLLWVEGPASSLHDIKSVQYLPPSWFGISGSQKPVKSSHDAFCTHYVLQVTSVGAGLPRARLNVAGGGYMVLDPLDSPSTPPPSCTTVVTSTSGGGNDGTPPPPSPPPTSTLIDVPDLIGLSQDQAVQVLNSLGLRSAVVAQLSDQPLNTVIDQDPAAETKVELGSQVSIIVAKGVEVPSIIGDTSSAAEMAVRRAGLEYAVAASGTDCGQAPGSVCEQSPGPGEIVRAGTTVTATLQK